MRSGSADGSAMSDLDAELTVIGGGAIQSIAFLTGDSGNIDIHVANANLNGGSIQTFAEAGRLGDIGVTASGTVTLSGPTSEISTSAADGLQINALAGNISVTAADIVLTDRATITERRSRSASWRTNHAQSNERHRDLWLGRHTEQNLHRKRRAG